MQHQTFPAATSLDLAASASGRRTDTVSDLVFGAHCLNRHTANLAILKYVDFQGFLVTGQHSGTHWIKWMLSHALAHRYGVEPPRYFNNASSNELIGHPKHPRRHPHLPRIASSHSIPPYALQWRWLRSLRRPPPYAVVVRDVRDLMISNYEKWRREYDVPFSRYVAGDPRGKAYVCDAWWYVRFANQWGAIAERYPEQTLVLRYEDFRRDPLENLRALARHFRLDLTDADLKAGIAVGSKEVMARHQDPGVDEKPVRPDGAGDTRFSPADLAVLGAILDRHLKHDFGYAYFDQPRGYQIAGAGADRPVAAPPGWRAAGARAA
ncbi:MAG: hypothetical protein JWO72_3078 [Caulobacteraceae bacterium]|nr:hypothetical protein [Caulobacteraceae bacterium]